MASPDASSPFPQRDFPSLLPLVFTLAVPAIINPFAQTVLVIPDDDPKLGPPPASMDSIKSMDSVVIAEGGDDQCVVCLEEWGVGDVARVMPCKHRFHGDCIEKWLGVCGSCPVCRYEMPPEEEGDDGKERAEEGSGRGGRVLVLSINFVGIHGGTVGESNPGGSVGHANSSASTSSWEE